MYKNRRPRMKKALGPIEEPDDLPPPVESRNTRSTPKKSALRFDEDETETTHKRRSLSKKETDELHTHSTRAKALKPANGQARRDPQSQSPERAVELNRSKLKRSELGLGLSPNRSASKRTRRTSESPLGPMLETAKASKAKPRMNVTSSDSEDEIGPSQNSTLKPLANSTQLSLGAKQQNKISRAIVKPYFEEVLLMSGFRFGKGQNCNILDRDQPAFLLKFKAEIEKNGRGQKNLEEFIKGFESYISEPHNFFKALDTTDTEDDSSATRKSQPCLVRLLLMVNSIQPKLMTILFDKLIGIVCAGNRQDEEAFELVQKILRTMRYLDHLVDGSAVCEQLLNLVELAEAVDVKREVISFIPDIISDAEHEKVASDLSEMLSANPPLIPAILCSLENLIMAPDTRDIVITKVLDILDRAPLNQQHTIMQFLTTVGTEMGLIVREIRKYINLDPSAAGNDGSEVAIFAENLKETVLNSKSLLDTWLDVLTNTEKKTFLPVDIVALLVFYQNSLDRKKSEVISAIKQHAHLGLDADKAISQAVPVIICVIEKYLDATLTIASTLLECRDSSVSRHGAIWFSLLVEHLQGTPSQQVINHLLGHVGSKAADQVSLALDILFDSGKKKIQSIAPYAHQLYGLLDKMEEWELTQVRQVLRLLCMLAYSCNEAMFLQDDIIMLVRKQLASSNPILLHLPDESQKGRNAASWIKMSVVRNSKFRHVYGKNLKRDNCYENIRVSQSSLDCMACAANPKFLAVIVDSSGGGAFLVIPLTKYGRISPDQPLVDGHKSYITDIAFSPHNDNVIASASDDCTVKIWLLPNEELTSPMSEPISNLLYHERRVNLILWHPTAQNLLLSAGSDNKVAIWNVQTAETVLQIDFHPDVVFSASWNWNGSKLVTTCKDKKIRIIDPRSGIVEEEALCHEGSKPTRAVFLKDGKIFTTGFSKMSNWQYSLREPGRLADPLCLESNDNTNGVIFPLYDAGTSLVYLCGKGDSLIRYYEITDEAPYVHPINLVITPEPQRGIGMMPKRGCDVKSCEVARFYRLSSSGHCQVISMTCPRKSELFQADLFPDTPSEEPGLFAEEWIAGLNADPVLMSLRFGRSLPGATTDAHARQSMPKEEKCGTSKSHSKPNDIPEVNVSVSAQQIFNESDQSSEDDYYKKRSASNLSTLQADKANRKPRDRASSLSDDNTADEYLPRLRSVSSYSKVSETHSEIADLNEEIALHAERLRALEEIIGSREHLPIPRVTSVKPKTTMSMSCDPIPDKSAPLIQVETATGSNSNKYYAELKTVPKCYACEETIFDQEYTFAGGKTYHVKHFSCCKCDKVLAGNEYFLYEDEMPICSMCKAERY